jgi:AcrR family transcriptional regulator
MSVAERAAERAVRGPRARAEAEVRALVDAGLRVLRRDGAATLTVAGVLAEAGLSTRAFYRHFESKDELLLAVYEHDALATLRRLGERIDASDDAASAVAAWIDETLSLAYDAPRAARTRVLAAEARRLQAEYPEEFASIASAQLAPLVDALERGRSAGVFPRVDPARDARSIHAVVWALVEERLDHDGAMAREDALAYALGFCLPALQRTAR